MPRKIHILQHASFLGPGTIESWANLNKLSITRTKFFNKEWTLPEISDFDLLVIMGGPMSVNDEAQYPWLSKEKAFIRQAIEADKKVLGMCLGAQLIASVLGARVYPNKHKEIGWFNIEKTSDAKHVSLTNCLPDSLCVFHWHELTFDLPDGAYQLFRSEACEQQIFAIGSNILGIQFHFEVSADDILGFIENNPPELPKPFVQTASQIKDNLSQATSVRPILFKLMDDFMQLPVKESSLQTTKG